MEPTRLDPDSCYRAVVARDTRFDGHFFTAVTTTGIYCRPICSARTPRRSSCDFYRTAAAAEHAGFRPCLRCRPELAPGRVGLQHDARGSDLRAACRRARSTTGRSRSLAADIGLSSRQVRRIVLDHFGVTPIEVAQTHRLLFAKKLLQETTLPITQLAFASGFHSLRRFNAAFRERYGLAPSALRRGRPATRRGMRDDAYGDIVLRLSYRPPLDWDALADVPRDFAATPRRRAASRRSTGRRSIAAPCRCRRRAGPVDGWLSVTRATHAARSSVAATPDVLTVTLPSTLLPVLMSATQRLRELLDLDADPLRIAAHLRERPAARARGRRAAPDCGCRARGSRFELALRAVLGQQVSVAGASTLSGRLARRFGSGRSRRRSRDSIAAAVTRRRARVGRPRGHRGDRHAEVAREHRPRARALRGRRRPADAARHVVRRRGRARSTRSPASARGPRTTSRCARCAIPMRSRPATSGCARRSACSTARPPCRREAALDASFARRGVRGARTRRSTLWHALRRTRRLPSHREGRPHDPICYRHPRRARRSARCCSPRSERGLRALYMQRQRHMPDDTPPGLVARASTGRAAGAHPRRRAAPARRVLRRDADGVRPAARRSRHAVPAGGVGRARSDPVRRARSATASSRVASATRTRSARSGSRTVAIRCRSSCPAIA